MVDVSRETEGSMPGRPFAFLTLHRIGELATAFGLDQEDADWYVAHEINARITEVTNEAEELEFTAGDQEHGVQKDIHILVGLTSRGVPEHISEQILGVPDIDELRVLCQDSGVKFTEVATYLGVSPSLVTRLFKRERKNPIILKQIHSYVTTKRSKTSKQ